VQRSLISSPAGEFSPDQNQPLPPVVYFFFDLGGVTFQLLDLFPRCHASRLLVVIVWPAELQPPQESADVVRREFDPLLRKKFPPGCVKAFVQDCLQSRAIP